MRKSGRGSNTWMRQRTALSRRRGSATRVAAAVIFGQRTRITTQESLHKIRLLIAEALRPHVPVFEALIPPAITASKRRSAR